MAINHAKIHCFIVIADEKNIFLIRCTKFNPNKAGLFEGSFSGGGRGGAGVSI